MVESIKQYRVLAPIIIKPTNNGYIIISGHNRANAAKIAGLKTIKAVTVDVDEDEAAIIVVESNFRQRDSITHSEKALAYKMKYDAMKRRGKRTDLDVNKEVLKLSFIDMFALKYLTNEAIFIRMKLISLKWR